MIKKVQTLLILAVICLSGYLVYDMYHVQIRQWIDHTQKETESREETEREDIETEEDGHRGKDLPGRYDLREQQKAPSVKDQGDLGTCWAITASSSLESVLLPKEHTVFSADHISLQNPYQKGQEDGGAYTMSIAYFAAWLGPVREDQDPYGDGSSPKGLAPIKHVQEMQMIMDKDIQDVKRLVYQYGAVQSSFYMDMESSAHTSVFYNQFEKAYCYQGEKDPNHDVLIIGWDDAYPKERFTMNVKRDGAFICQNSWGDKFGDNGIFYVSYEDALIASYCLAYTRVDEPDNYDHLYQSDLCGWVGQLGYGTDTCYFANVYESKGKERAEAVGFYATDRDTRYTIYKTEFFDSPLSLAASKKVQSGTLKNPGYYTIDLEEPIQLEPGQRFALSIKIKTPGSEYPVATEYQADQNTSMVTIEDGEGYISSNGYNWKRAEEGYGCNLCLKVYTSDIF